MDKKPKIRFKNFTSAWEQRKLSEIVNFSRGQGLSWSDVDDKNGKFECVLYGNLYTDYDTIISKIAHKSKIKGSVLSKKFDVLMPASDTTPTGLARALCIINSGISLGGDINILSPIRDNGMCIAYSLNHHKSELIKRIKGTTVRHLQKGDIEDLKIPLPINIEEQAKISKYLYKLDNLITLQERKYEKLINVKKSMLEKMFPKNNSKFPEIRFKGFTDAWEQRKVGDITNVLSASRVHKNEWTTEGVPFYRSSDVVSAFKRNDNEKAFISQSLYEKLIKSSGKLEKGDILITGGGSIGIPYIVPNNNPLYSKDADLIWIKKSSLHDSSYLYTYFTSRIFREYIGSISHVGTIAHYTIEQVKDTPILLPNMDEQKTLGSFFRNLDSLISLHQRKCEKLKNIKKSMLEKMFV